MIIVFVKHFLNPEGIEYLTTKWFNKVKSYIETQPGYMALDYHLDAHDKTCVNITVKFDSEESLEAWIATNEHAEVIDLLDSYRVKDWQAARTNNEFEDPNKLKWITIPKS